jgi:hypothetical protein
MCVLPVLVRSLAVSLKTPYLVTTPTDSAHPHTVQSDTTRCGDGRVGHPGRASIEASSTSTYRFYFPIMHQNNIILLLDNNSLFLLGNIVL